jgi:hypothetical protein
MWGDGEHRFRLRIGELRELEAKRDSSHGEIWIRLASMKGRVDDIYEVLRLGLIGGGMGPVMALGLTAKYVVPTMFTQNTITARMVLQHALYGDMDDIVGKILAGITPESSPAEPNGQDTSAPAPLWDGQFATSTNVPSGNSARPSTDGADVTVLMNTKLHA